MGSLPSAVTLLPSGTLLQTLDLQILLRRIDCRIVLSTSLEKGGQSERDKLVRRNTSELRRSATVVYRTNRMVKLCLQHEFVARVN